MRKDEFPIVDKLVKDSINDVLDKIRNEIEQNAYDDVSVSGLKLISVNRVNQIIDKYRAESEPQESEDKNESNAYNSCIR